MAIRINPQSPIDYRNRGVVKSKLGDKKGAIPDLNIAAQLLKAQNNMAGYEQVMNSIQEISR